MKSPFISIKIFTLTAAKQKAKQWRKKIVDAPKTMRGISLSIYDLRP